MSGRNEQDGYESRGNPLSTLIKTAVGLSPLGFAAYKMMDSARSNAAINPAVPLGVGRHSGGNLPRIGRGIGQHLGAAAKDNYAQDLKRLKSVSEEIMKSEVVDRMFSEVSQRHAVVQSLLETLDDPAFADSAVSDTLLSIKERLIDLSRDEADPEELRKVIQSTVASITSKAPEATQLRWAKNLREYQKLGPVLVAPGKTPFEVSRTATAVDPMELAGLAREGNANARAALSEYDYLTSGLGKRGKQNVSIVSNVWGGAQQYYAQVFTGDAGRSSLIDTIPLKVSPGNSGFTPVFTNQNLTTGYAAPRHILDAQRVASALAGGAKTSEDVVKQAGVGIERYFIDNLLGRMKDGKFQGQHKEYRSWRSQFLEVMHRRQYSTAGDGVNYHLNKTAAQASNYAHVVGFDKMNPEMQEKLMLDLANVDGFDANAPGYQHLVRGLGNQPIGRVGMREGSAIESVRSIGRATRGYFPVESRIEQVFHNKGAMFIGDEHRTMGRGGVLTAGPTAIRKGKTIEHVGESIEWAGALTGSTNKAILFPIKGSMYDAIEGTGVAYSSGKERTLMFTTQPIIDPNKKGYMASKLFMDELAGKAKPGEVVSLTREQIERHGGFLGFGPQGSQHLRMDPRMKDMQLAYTITESGGKQQINILSDIDREMDRFKGFGLQHKGGFEPLPGEAFNRKTDTIGMSREMKRRLRIKNRDMIIADPSMLKKGAGFFDLQLRGGFAAVAGETHYDNLLRDLARTHHYPSLPDTDLGRTTGAVLKGLSTRVGYGKGMVHPEDAGAVLSALYSRGGTRDINGVKGWMGSRNAAGRATGPNAFMAIEQEDLDKAMQQAFGQHYEAVKKVAAGDFALSTGSFSQGTGPGDWGQARGSVETRFATNLQHRLRNMGLSTDEAAEVISGVYKNKIGFAQGLKSAQGLLELAEGITGNTGMVGAAEDALKNLKQYDLSDIQKLGAKGFDKLLVEHPEGFMLNLTSGATTTSGRAIAANAADVFGASGPIRIGGKAIADSMKETLIKSARDISGNTKDTPILGEYTQMVDRLLKGLSSGGSHQLDAPEATRTVLEEFKKSAIDLTARAVAGVSRGKIKGMGSGFNAIYTLGEKLEDSNFSTAKNMKLANDLFTASKGQAVFFDSYMFLSQMNDWMGTSQGTTKDVARKLEMFFLSGEEMFRTGQAGKARGIVQLGQRHPTAGLGSVVAGQVFRHVEELGGNGQMDDKIFGHMAGVQSQWKGIQSWNDVAALPSGGPGGNQRLAFFTSMAEELHQFAPAGGGTVFLPRRKADVSVKGRGVVRMDVGFAPGMGADWDGDQLMWVPVNAESGKRLMGTLKGSAADEWLRDDLTYRVKSSILAEEAKAGLKHHTVGQDIGFDSAERVRQSVLKEQAAKEAAGRLDVEFTKVRAALYDLTDKGQADRNAVSEAIAVLYEAQEHGNFKGKKLPVYLPFAKRMTEAAKRAFQTGDIDEFRDVLKNQVFVGSAAWSDEGLTIEKVSASGLPWADGVKDVNINLNRSMDLMQQAIQTANATGVASQQNPYAIIKALSSPMAEESAQAMAIIQAGNTLDSSVLRGSQPTTGRHVAAGVQAAGARVSSSLDVMDKRLMGIGAMAVAGSLAVMGLIGSQGYAPKPMVVEGEMVSPDVRAAIGRGDVFTPAPTSRSNSGYPQAQPDMMPSTYLRGQNAYQVQGEVKDIRRIGQIGDYVGSLPGGSRGSIRVNDSRRPLSQSWIGKQVSGEY